MDVQAAKRLKQYEETVREFLVKENGFLFTLSHDNSFYRNLKAIVSKQLMVAQDCVRHFSEHARMTKDLMESKSKNFRFVIFIERIMNGHPTTDLIKHLIAGFPEVHILVLTSEVDKEKLVLLHEIGVTNYIIKPISINNLIEKIAFTVRPQTKFGQLLDEGKKMILHGEYDKAFKLSELILSMKPGSAAGYMLRGDALKGLGEKEKAVAAYESAHKSSSMYLDPLKKLADFYGESNDKDEQLNYLEKLDKLSPLNVDRKVSIGEIHINKGEKEKAENYFDGAIKLATKEAMSAISEVTKKIAHICINNNPDMSEKYYRMTIESKKDLSKEDVETLNTLGIALRKQKKYAEAIDNYEKALKISPRDENLHYNLAMVYVDKGDNMKAYQTIKRILEMNDSFGEGMETIYYNMGMIYYKVSKNKEAVGFFKKALELNPDNKDTKGMVEALSK